MAPLDTGKRSLVNLDVDDLRCSDWSSFSFSSGSKAFSTQVGHLQCSVSKESQHTENIKG